MSRPRASGLLPPALIREMIVQTPYGNAAVLSPDQPLDSSIIVADASGLVSVRFIEWTATARLNVSCLTPAAATTPAGVVSPARPIQSAVPLSPKLKPLTPAGEAALRKPAALPAPALRPSLSGGAVPRPQAFDWTPKEAEWLSRQTSVRSNTLLLKSGVHLYVNLVGARHLLAADMNGLSDPYAVIHVGSKQRERTSVVPKTLNPTWQESFVFNVDDDCHYIRIELFDKDAVGSDDPLGTVCIPLAHLSVTPTTAWYPVGRLQSQLKACGELHVECMITRTNDAALAIDRELAELTNRIPLIAYDPIVVARAGSAAPATGDSAVTTPGHKIAPSTIGFDSKSPPAPHHHQFLSASGPAGLLSPRGGSGPSGSGVAPSPRGIGSTRPNSELSVVPFPGPASERVEMKVDNVRLAISGQHTRGRCFLTNYRLVFVSDRAVDEFPALPVSAAAGGGGGVHRVSDSSSKPSSGRESGSFSKTRPAAQTVIRIEAPANGSVTTNPTAHPKPASELSVVVEADDAAAAASGEHKKSVNASATAASLAAPPPALPPKKLPKKPQRAATTALIIQDDEVPPPPPPAPETPVNALSPPLPSAHYIGGTPLVPAAHGLSTHPGTSDSKESDAFTFAADSLSPRTNSELDEKDPYDETDGGVETERRRGNLVENAAIRVDLSLSIPVGCIDHVIRADGEHLLKTPCDMLVIFCKDFRKINLFLLNKNSVSSIVQRLTYHLHNFNHTHDLAINRPVANHSHNTHAPAAANAAASATHPTAASPTKGASAAPPVLVPAPHQFPLSRQFVDDNQSLNVSNVWSAFRWDKEIRRWELPLDRFRVDTKSNAEYELSPTYPSVLIYPAEITPADIVKAAPFRSKSRLPVLTWYNKRSGNCLIRCSQPHVGLKGKFSPADEALIRAFRMATPKSDRLTVIDARSRNAALGNQLKGEGTEDTNRYEGVKLLYSDIGNIHAMRSSIDSLRDACLSTSLSEESWLGTVQKSGWLTHVRGVLAAATNIAHEIEEKKNSVLIHCSDGWDRTTQLCALAQVMLDPYYRTIDGFTVLIDKDWCSFGHKFAHRLGALECPDERSPVFLQFLDCVHQILDQFPTHFEFTVDYLVTIATALTSGYYGNFLVNSERERKQRNIESTTVSLWSHIAANRAHYRSAVYYSAHYRPHVQHLPSNSASAAHFQQMASAVLLPICSVKRLRVWSEYYLRYDELYIHHREREEDALRHALDDTNRHIMERNQEKLHERRASKVLWVPDEWTDECRRCTSKFSFFRWRHHCRACGNLFCAECVKQKLALPHMGYKRPVLVCEQCFQAQTIVLRQQEMGIANKRDRVALPARSGMAAPPPTAAASGYGTAAGDHPTRGGHGAAVGSGVFTIDPQLISAAARAKK